MNKREFFKDAFKSSYRVGILYRPLGFMYLVISSLFFIQAFYFGEVIPDLNWQTLQAIVEHFTISNWVFIFFLMLQALIHFAGKKQPNILIYLSEMSLIVNNFIVLNFYFQSSSLGADSILMAIVPIVIFFLFNRFTQIFYKQNNKIKSLCKPNLIHVLVPNYKIKPNTKEQNQKTG